MNVVVEIGCREQPGPFFEGADRHYIVDPDAENLAKGALTDVAFTAVVADASNLDFLADASVNTFLARNVFGDPALFTDSTKRREMQAEVIELLEASKVAEAYERTTAAEIECAPLKSAILSEAGRVLVVGGRLIVVEQYSPNVARRFFKSIAGDPALTGGLDIKSASLPAIAPASYVEHQVDAEPVLVAWTAQKH